MKKSFKNFMDSMINDIADYKYYVNFEKVYSNVDKIKVELNILNSLIGSQNIEEEFKNLVLKYPDTLECIPILLAVRSTEVYVKTEIKEYLYNFRTIIYSMDDYIKFMRETGLFDLLQNHIINNLYDYVLGVEVGLDTNARKNRTGDTMEDLVESYIINAGYKYNVDYFKEMYLNEIEDKWHIDLSSISANNVSTKRFDFVIKTDMCIYIIESNFYSTSGSKLNETARSYKMIALESKDIEGVKFIWITDGKGWKNATHNLEETYNVMDTLYNINDLDNGVLERL